MLAVKVEAKSLGPGPCAEQSKTSKEHMWLKAAGVLECLDCGDHFAEMAWGQQCWDAVRVLETWLGLSGVQAISQQLSAVEGQLPGGFRLKARVAKAEAAEWQWQVRQRQQAGVPRPRKHRCISEKHAVQLVEQQCRDRIECRDQLLRDELLPVAWRACAQQCAAALAQAIHLQLLERPGNALIHLGELIYEAAQAEWAAREPQLPKRAMARSQGVRSAGAAGRGTIGWFIELYS